MANKKETEFDKGLKRLSNLELITLVKNFAVILSIMRKYLNTDKLNPDER